LTAAPNKWLNITRTHNSIILFCIFISFGLKTSYLWNLWRHARVYVWLWQPVL